MPCNLVTTMLSSLVGALVVYIFGIRKHFIERRGAYIEKQLSEFYSPLAGYRKRIRAKSELRIRVSDAARAAWLEHCAQNPETPLNHEEPFEPYKSIIEYDNQQFREELFPLYKKMLDLFTEKYWLADSDTRTFYQEFLEFVEIWERVLAKALPHDVVNKLGHAEEKLHPFYEHNEEKLNKLQLELKDERFWKLRV